MFNFVVNISRMPKTIKLIKETRKTLFDEFQKYIMRRLIQVVHLNFKRQCEEYILNKIQFPQCRH